MKRALLYAAVWFVVLGQAPAGAEVWQWFRISQPLMLNGLEIVDSPYLVRHWGYPQQVEMTAWENLLYTAGTWKDRNAASQFGLQVRLGPPGYGSVQFSV
jgi:hypothetical protein